tara:strand:+ start:3642 stop:4832 length:1191 start_codon:yes stop_codon:yes gene_type:complete
MINETVIVGYARTPIGSFQGLLSSIPATKLGSLVIKSSIQRSNIKPSIVEEVILGNVLLAGEGQAPARQSSIYAGLDNSVECLTINKVCGSGLKAVMLADQSIKLNNSEVVVAGGMENMSQVPYYLFDARKGMRLGDKKVVDGIFHDGLIDAYSNLPMGNCAEVLAKEQEYSKKIQDDFAKESYNRSINSIKKGYFKPEIIPIDIPQKNGSIVTINKDEEPERVKLDNLSKLKPVFEKEGTISVGNASSINDGAAALVLMSRQKADELNIKPLCKIIAQTTVAQDPLYFTKAPCKSISKVLEKSDMSIEDIDLFEINEAFSNVVLYTMDQHSISHKKVNIFGGAVSLGHPIGASGARILVTLISALEQKNKKYGLASICIGGGEACALIIENLGVK